MAWNIALSITDKCTETFDESEPTSGIRICRDLLEQGAQLAFFDPKVSAEQIRADLGVEVVAGSDGAAMQGHGVWQPAADRLAAAQGADAVSLLTEWQQFPGLPQSLEARRSELQASCLRPVATEPSLPPCESHLWP